MSLRSVIDTSTARDWRTPVKHEPLQIAIIGLGRFGADVGLSAITAASNCRPTALVSGSADKASSVAEDAGVEHALTYEEYRDGVASDAYDAVYVTTPHSTHLEHVEIAAELGKDVICEKSLEATAKRAERLVETCEEHGVMLMTAYRMQLAPLARRMRELVHDGAVGDPVSVDGSFTIDVLAQGGPSQWRLDAELGGGALLDIGVYPVNTSRYILDAEPIAVAAHTASVNETFTGVEEHVSFQLEFENDVVLSAHVGYNEHPENHLTISGTEGRLTLEPGFKPQRERTLTLDRDDGTATVTDDTNEIIEQFEYFATRVLSGTPIDPDGRDGLRDMRIAEAVREAADTGSWIRL